MYIYLHRCVYMCLYVCLYVTACVYVYIHDIGFYRVSINPLGLTTPKLKVICLYNIKLCYIFIF